MLIEHLFITKLAAKIPGHFKYVNKPIHNGYIMKVTKIRCVNLCLKK